MKQLVSGTVDTQKNSYRSIGQVNAADDLELELEVKMNGKPIEFINPQAELLMKKADNNKVRQTKNILYQDGKFRIKVDEQGVTYPGIVTNQLVINDEGRVSTCLFYFMVGTSLDREILQSISKIETLEQLDEYVVTAFANLDEYEKRIIAGDSAIRKLNDDMIAAETNRENAEADRGSTFDNLVTRMNNVINVAITTDETLNNNETARINNFNTLKTELEQIREGLLNLNNSISLDEQNRVQAELDRANASIEAINRLNTINTNITNEEATRVQEWNNIKSENTTLKEALTTINNTANSNEEVRKKKEEERIAAELQRQANFETMQQENNTFKGKIDAQYEQINTKVISVEERVQAIENEENTDIDDTTISKDKTWSSEKIEDSILTNSDVVWSDVQGENLSIEFTKEGHLREVEIWGNTWQDDTDSKNLVNNNGGYIVKKYSNDVRNHKICTIEKSKMKVGTKYTMSTKTVLGTDMRLNLYGVLGDTLTNLCQMYSTTSSTITLNADYDEYFLCAYALNNTEAVGYNLKGVQLEEGSVATDYVDYHKADLSNIKHLGELYVDEEGNPILDSDSREQYKIEIESRNFYNEEELLTSTPKAHKTTILLPCQLCKVGDVSDRLYWDSEKEKYVVEKNIKKTLATSVRGYQKKNIDGVDYCRFWQINQELGNVEVRGQKNINGVIEKMIYSHENNRMINGLIEETAFLNMGYTLNDAGVKQYIQDNDIHFYYATTVVEYIETNITEQILLPCYKDKTHLFVTGNLDGTIKAKAPLDGGQAVQTLSARNLSLNKEVNTLSLENEEIKEVNNTQDILIDTTMMATDEVYTMLEPILEMIPQTMSLERSVSKMVDMYVAMVQRGLKTIEQVPARYREEVREILAKLEK
ncbi:CD1375 family protein [Clostridium celatum]|uniref:CD1375 family protein n=1 Tax=Clostridium celatum TaxID=36834 RepID=UPI00189791A1|nr:CD1375 family protein [Clostridium celatum]